MQSEATPIIAKVLHRSTRSKHFALLVTGILVGLGILQPLSLRFAYAHRVQPPPAPIATTSYYVATLNGQKMRDKGCQQGYKSAYGIGGPGPSDGLVILAFGQPWYEGGEYGTIIYDDKQTFQTTTNIGNAVKEFALGFWSCTPVSGPKLKIGIGTSNYDCPSNPGCGRLINFRAHGRLWAFMVQGVERYIRSQPGWSSQLSVAGASDIELDWSTPVRARDWIAGYTEVYNSSSSPRVPYYDFGDAAGCYPYNGGSGWYCNNGWTSEDVWWKTYGAPPALPVPEIYFTVNNLTPRIAGVWQKLSLYSVLNHRYKIGFQGVMTQYDACGGYTTRRLEPDCYNNRNPNTGVFTNSPNEGWDQLMYKLNNNDPAYHGEDRSQDWCTQPQPPPAHQCHRTDRSNIRYSTDISNSLR